MTWRTSRVGPLAAAAVAVAVLLAGCGGNSTGTAGTGSTSDPIGHGANQSGPAAEAAATTKTYTERPSAFPVSSPLPALLPPGTKFGWLQCVSSVCAQLTGLFDAATKAIGGQLVVVKAGASTQQVQSAFASLLEQKPAAILLPSIQPQTVTAQIQQAAAAGIPTVATGVMNPQSFGISAGTFGRATATLAGKLMADFVATRGSKTNVVFYTTKELDFLIPEEAAFRAELQRVCGGCSSRTVNIPIAGYGSTAPALVVSDLQAHPDTKIALFGAAAGASGLVAAMKNAGLTLPFAGFSLTPENLQSIDTGSQLAGLALDYPVIAWTMIDEAARLLMKAPLSDAQAQGLVPVQWLNSGNVTGDLTKGWTGYSDYASRFTQLWHTS